MIETKGYISVPAITHIEISRLPKDKRVQLIHYKALAFNADRKNAALSRDTTFVIETKGLKPDWDPGLGPGGGWRCPQGSRYGGYITDKFGRGCGGGILRRLGDALGQLNNNLASTTGAGLAATGERRDMRRLARAAARQRYRDDTNLARSLYPSLGSRALDRLGFGYRRTTYGLPPFYGPPQPKRRNRGANPNKPPIVTRVLDRTGDRYNDMLDRILYGKNRPKKKTPSKRTVVTGKVSQKRKKKSPTAKKPSIITRLLDNTGDKYNTLIDRVLYGRNKKGRSGRRSIPQATKQPVKKVTTPRAKKKKAVVKKATPKPVLPKKKIGTVGKFDPVSLSPKNRTLLAKLAQDDLDDLETFWRKMLNLGPADPLEQTEIDDFIENKIKQYKPGDKSAGAYIGFLKAQSNDYQALKAWKDEYSNDANGDAWIGELNKLGPTRRKKFLDALNASAPPKKKAPAKKVPAKKKPAPAKPAAKKPVAPTPQAPAPQAPTPAKPAPTPKPAPAPKPVPVPQVPTPNITPEVDEIEPIDDTPVDVDEDGKPETLPSWLKPVEDDPEKELPLPSFLLPKPEEPEPEKPEFPAWLKPKEPEAEIVPEAEIIPEPVSPLEAELEEIPIVEPEVAQESNAEYLEWLAEQQKLLSESPKKSPELDSLLGAINVKNDGFYTLGEFEDTPDGINDALKFIQDTSKIADALNYKGWIGLYKNQDTGKFIARPVEYINPDDVDGSLILAKKDELYGTVDLDSFLIKDLIGTSLPEPKIKKDKPEKIFVPASVTEIAIKTAGISGKDSRDLIKGLIAKAEESGEDQVWVALIDGKNATSFHGPVSEIEKIVKKSLKANFKQQIYFLGHVSGKDGFSQFARDSYHWYQEIGKHNGVPLKYRPNHTFEMDAGELDDDGPDAWITAFLNPNYDGIKEMFKQNPSATPYHLSGNDKVEMTNAALLNYLGTLPDGHEAYKIRRRPASASKSRIAFAELPWFGHLGKQTGKSVGQRYKVLKDGFYDDPMFGPDQTKLTGMLHSALADARALAYSQSKDMFIIDVAPSDGDPIMNIVDLDRLQFLISNGNKFRIIAQVEQTGGTWNKTYNISINSDYKKVAPDTPLKFSSWLGARKVVSQKPPDDDDETDPVGEVNKFINGVLGTTLPEPKPVAAFNFVIEAIDSGDDVDSTIPEVEPIFATKTDEELADVLNGVDTIDWWKANSPFEKSDLDEFVIQAKQSAKNAASTDGIPTVKKVDSALGIVNEQIAKLEKGIPLNKGNDAKWDTLRSLFIARIQKKHLEYLRKIAKTKEDLDTTAGLAAADIGYKSLPADVAVTVDVDQVLNDETITLGEALDLIGSAKPIKEVLEEKLKTATGVVQFGSLPEQMETLTGIPMSNIDNLTTWSGGKTSATLDSILAALQNNKPVTTSANNEIKELEWDLNNLEFVVKELTVEATKELELRIKAQLQLMNVNLLNILAEKGISTPAKFLNKDMTGVNGDYLKSLSNLFELSYDTLGTNSYISWAAANDVLVMAKELKRLKKADPNKTAKGILYAIASKPGASVPEIIDPAPPVAKKIKMSLNDQISFSDIGALDLVDTLGVLMDQAMVNKQRIMIWVTNDSDEKITIGTYKKIIVGTYEEMSANWSNVGSVIAGVMPNGAIYVSASSTANQSKWLSKVGKYGTGGWDVPLGAAYKFEGESEFEVLDKLYDAKDNLIISKDTNDGGWSIGAAAPPKSMFTPSKDAPPTTNMAGFESPDAANYISLPGRIKKSHSLVLNNLPEAAEANLQGTPIKNSDWANIYDTVISPGVDIPLLDSEDADWFNAAFFTTENLRDLLNSVAKSGVPDGAEVHFYVGPEGKILVRVLPYQPSWASEDVVTKKKGYKLIAVASLDTPFLASGKNSGGEPGINQFWIASNIGDTSDLDYIPNTLKTNSAAEFKKLGFKSWSDINGGNFKKIAPLLDAALKEILPSAADIPFDDNTFESMTPDSAPQWISPSAPLDIENTVYTMLDFAAAKVYQNNIGVPVGSDVDFGEYLWLVQKANGEVGLVKTSDLIPLVTKGVSKSEPDIYILGAAGAINDGTSSYLSKLWMASVPINATIVTSKLGSGVDSEEIVDNLSGGKPFSGWSGNFAIMQFPASLLGAADIDGHRGYVWEGEFDEFLSEGAKEDLDDTIKHIKEGIAGEHAPSAAAYVGFKQLYDGFMEIESSSSLSTALSDWDGFEAIPGPLAIAAVMGRLYNKEEGDKHPWVVDVLGGDPGKTLFLVRNTETGRYHFMWAPPESLDAEGWLFKPHLSNGIFDPNNSDLAISKAGTTNIPKFEIVAHRVGNMTYFESDLGFALPENSEEWRRIVIADPTGGGPRDLWAQRSITGSETQPPLSLYKLPNFTDAQIATGAPDVSLMPLLHKYKFGYKPTDSLPVAKIQTAKTVPPSKKVLLSDIADGINSGELQIGVGDPVSFNDVSDGSPMSEIAKVLNIALRRTGFYNSVSKDTKILVPSMGVWENISDHITVAIPAISALMRHMLQNGISVTDLMPSISNLYQLDIAKKEDSSFGLMTHGVLSKLAVAIANDPDFKFEFTDPTKFTLEKILSYFKPTQDGSFFIESSEGPFDTSPAGLVVLAKLLAREIHVASFGHDVDLSQIKQMIDPPLISSTGEPYPKNSFNYDTVFRHGFNDLDNGSIDQSDTIEVSEHIDGLISHEFDLLSTSLNEFAEAGFPTLASSPALQLQTLGARRTSIAMVRQLMGMIIDAENEHDHKRAKQLRAIGDQYIKLSPMIGALPEPIRARFNQFFKTGGFPPAPKLAKVLGHKSGSIVPKHGGFDGTALGSVSANGKAIAPHVGASALLQSVEDATAHLANGGSLAEVPDMFLLAAIKENIQSTDGDGKRFRIDKSISEGYNKGTFGVIDTLSPLVHSDGPNAFRRYIIKDAHRNAAEHLQEILGSAIEHELSIPALGHRIAGPMKMKKDKNGVSQIQRPIVMEHIANLFDKPGWTVVGHTTDLPAGTKWNPESLAKFIALNRFINHYDRTPQNLVVVLDPQGEAHLVPIDDGNAFYGYKLKTEGPLSLLTGDTAQESLDGFKTIDGVGHQWFKETQSLSTEDKLKFAVALRETVARIKGLDLDDVRMQLLKESGWSEEEISHIGAKLTLLGNRREALEWEKMYQRAVKAIGLEVADVEAEVKKQKEAAATKKVDLSSTGAQTAYNALAKIGKGRNTGAKFLWDGENILEREVVLSNAQIANSTTGIDGQALILQFRATGNAYAEAKKKAQSGQDGWKALPGRDQPMLPRYSAPSKTGDQVGPGNKKDPMGNGKIRYFDFHQSGLDSIGGNGQLYEKTLEDGTVIQMFVAVLSQSSYGKHSYDGHVVVIKPTENADKTVLSIANMDQVLDPALTELGITSTPPLQEELNMLGMRNLAVSLFGNDARSWNDQKVIDKLNEKGVELDDIAVSATAHHQPYIHLTRDVRDALSSQIKRIGILHGYKAGDTLTSFVQAMENGGVTGAYRRVTNGFPKAGISTSADTQRGSNDWSYHGWAADGMNTAPNESMFTAPDDSLATMLYLGGGSMTSSKIQTITPLEFALERVDTAWTQADSYGDPDTQTGILSMSLASNNQPLIRGQMPPSRSFHVFQSKSDLESAISQLKEKGITEFDGIPIENLFFHREDPNIASKAKLLIDLWRARGWVA